MSCSIVQAPASHLLILGRGRLGRSLSAAFQAAGLPARLRPARELDGLADDLAVASVVIVAVPDAAVDEVAASVARALPDGYRPALVHLSGARGLDALAAGLEAGCAVGSFHPFQPFASVRGPEAFAGSTVGVAASDGGLLRELEGLARRIGAHARVVADEQRALYHAAAVVASSFVVALAAQASGLLTALGWDRDDALAALFPLMEGAVANLKAEGLPGALSGPLRRGDAETVAGHVAAMHALERPETLDAYVALGTASVDLARGIGLSDEACDRLLAALARP